MGILRVSLFGKVGVRHDDRPGELKLTPVIQGLLAYLLLNSRYPQSRDVLAEQFWGEYSQERARGCLKTALWRLRRLLEPEDTPSGAYLLTTSRGDIGFNHDSPHWFDVETFLQQVTPALSRPAQEGRHVDATACSQALSLYTGDLLEGFYDNWAIHQRERLRIIYLNTLTWLVHYHEKECEFEKSLSYARKILEIDPLQEEIHRKAMRLYTKLGLRPQAIQQFEMCQAVLMRELGIAPMQETLQLFRLIMAGQGNLRTSSLLENHDLLTRVLTKLQDGHEALSQAQEQFREVSQLLQGMLRNK
jgi:DNA-binding SARP family transcriptional activator